MSSQELVVKDSSAYKSADSLAQNGFFLEGVRTFGHLYAKDAEAFSTRLRKHFKTSPAVFGQATLIASETIWQEHVETQRLANVGQRVTEFYGVTELPQPDIHEMQRANEIATELRRAA